MGTAVAAAGIGTAAAIGVSAASGGEARGWGTVVHTKGRPGSSCALLCATEGRAMLAKRCFSAGTLRATQVKASPRYLTSNLNVPRTDAYHCFTLLRWLRP